MHFKTVASLVLWTCASHAAAADLKPYRLAMMPVPDMSLLRRDTNGYQPEQAICGVGSTCAEACGEGYVTCPAADKATHCFNPNKKQTCCSDGTGNSCDKGFYCTHDTAGHTLCCPDSMDLVQCAAAYSVTGGLQPATATPTSTSSSTRTPSSSSVPATSSATSSTPLPVTTSKLTPATTKTKAKETTVCASSSGYTTAWNGSNSTVSSAVLTTKPTKSTPVVTLQTTATIPPPVTTGTSGAGAVGVSVMLIAAAGLVALF